MSLYKRISSVCRSASTAIRRISTFRQYLTVEGTKTLVCAFVLSKLDYCNSHLSGRPLYIFRRPQKAQNSAVKLVFKSHRRDHVQPLLQALYCLLVQARIDYNCQLSVTISSLTYPLTISPIVSLCTHLPDNFVLLQTHGHYASPMLKLKPLASSVSLSVLKTPIN